MKVSAVEKQSIYYKVYCLQGTYQGCQAQKVFDLQIFRALDLHYLKLMEDRFVWFLGLVTLLACLIVLGSV